MNFNRKIYLALFISFLGLTTYAQDLRLTVGTGVASYYGDLIKENSALLKQTSAAFSFGATYDIQSQLRARLNVSLMSVKGDDQYSKDQGHKSRNLNFKSNIWEIALMGEYDFLDRESYNIVPYVFTGIGVYHFNPYTNDSIAGKVFLHDVGTEGQYLGLPGYPSPYSRTQINIPFGFGIRYEVSESVSLALEMNYRFLFTDYLDDVSTKYVNPTSLFYSSSYYTANNNYYADLASRLGFKAEDPKNSITMPRGNPNKNDRYYSIQITATFKLENFSLFGLGSSPFGGGGYNSSRHYTY